MTYTQQLDLLYQGVLQDIRDLIRKKGVESEFTNEKVILFDGQIPVPDDIAEFGETCYRDSNGYEFYYSALDWDTLALIGDHLKITV